MLGSIGYNESIYTVVEAETVEAFVHGLKGFDSYILRQITKLPPKKTLIATLPPIKIFNY
jgi:hypothetical protein